MSLIEEVHKSELEKREITKESCPRCIHINYVILDMTDIDFEVQCDDCGKVYRILRNNYD